MGDKVQGQMLRAEISQLRRNNTISHSGQVASREEGNENVLSYTKGPLPVV